jgi:hypothetical protein
MVKAAVARVAPRMNWRRVRPVLEIWFFFICIDAMEPILNEVRPKTQVFLLER